MPGVLTRAGRLALANAMRGAVFFPAETFTILLSKSDFGYAAGIISGLEAADFGGYADVALNVSELNAATLDGEDAVLQLCGDDPFVWDCTSGPQTIYGWLLFDNDSGDVYGFDKYDTPHVLEIGSRHTLYPSIRIGACG